ncbi:hypothetical protein [Bacillus sp. NA_165.1]|uniref:hypothetical protein n=1 Tax=unclassified Bacillus (in: firmicutes) TaxID=185979 RepID=UPI004045BB8C
MQNTKISQQNQEREDNSAISWTIVLFMIPFLIMMFLVDRVNTLIESHWAYVVLVAIVIIILLAFFPRLTSKYDIPLVLKLATIIVIEIVYSYIFILIIAILIIFSIPLIEKYFNLGELLLNYIYILMVLFALILKVLISRITSSRNFYEEFFKIKNAMEKEFDLTYLATICTVILALFQSSTEKNGISYEDIIFNYITSATFAVFTINHALKRLSHNYKKKLENIKSNLN